MSLRKEKAVKFIYGVIIPAVIVGVILGFYFKIRYLEEQLEEQGKVQKERIASMENDLKVAFPLLKNSIWYIVNPSAVSSLPNCKGEIVNLGGTLLRAKGNHLGIKHPDFNKKISFSPSESRSEAYVVAGGWLTYQYLD